MSQSMSQSMLADTRYPLISDSEIVEVREPLREEQCSISNFNLQRCQVSCYIRSFPVLCHSVSHSDYLLYIIQWYLMVYNHIMVYNGDYFTLLCHV